MRIVGKTHDYYDSALAHGADMDLVYARATVETEGCADDLGPAFDMGKAPRGDHFFDERRQRWATSDRFVPNLLLFCGKAVPFFRQFRYRPGAGSRPNLFHFEAGAVHAAVAETLGPGPLLDRYTDRRPLGFGCNAFSRREVDAWFGGTLDEGRAAEIHQRHGSPVILYKVPAEPGRIRTVVDPVLRDIEFYRLRDAFTAFQDIAMYLGGVLRGNENPTVALSDRDRLAKHGMDPKWSFRRPPEATRPR